MRKIEDVINQIVLVAHKENRELCEQLERLKQKTFLTAPELMGMRWQQGGELLQEYFPKRVADFAPWQKSVAETWSTYPYEVLLKADQERISREEAVQKMSSGNEKETGTKEIHS